MCPIRSRGSRRREILVDYDLDAEEALFILVHLFGHTVQWNVSPADRALGLLEVREPSDELLASLARYEVDAARYSLQLFHEAGVHDLDQWLANFVACDIAYLMHFYRTGEKRAFRSFWVDGAPPLSPLEIPPSSRRSGWRGAGRSSESRLHRAIGG